MAEIRFNHFSSFNIHNNINEVNSCLSIIAYCVSQFFQNIYISIISFYFYNYLYEKDKMFKYLFYTRSNSWPRVKQPTRDHKQVSYRLGNKSTLFITIKKKNRISLWQKYNQRNK